jgi:hypothetical protein
VLFDWKIAILAAHRQGSGPQQGIEFWDFKLFDAEYTVLAADCIGF